MARAEPRTKKQQVLDYIEQFPGCTRVDIATGTGISYGQVIRYTRDLTGAAQIQGRMHKGRTWRLYPLGHGRAPATPDKCDSEAES